MFIEALFTTYGSNLSFHQQTNGQRYGIQYNEILPNYKKKMKFCHLQHHGWAWTILCLVK